MGDPWRLIVSVEPLPGRGPAGRRVKIVFADGDSLELPLELAVGRGWAEGVRVEAGEVERARRRGEAFAAREHALRLLDHQARTRSELRRRLEQAGYGPVAIRFALAWCTARGFVDDRRFARLWLESRMTRPEYGSFRIRQELVERGIDPSLARAVVEEGLPPERELERAVEASRRRRSGGRAAPGADGPPDRAEAIRLGRYLASRGFPYGTIREALQRLGADAPPEEEP